jgi:hypothetical protein
MYGLYRSYFFSGSLDRGGDWNLGVQLTLFQPGVGEGEDYAHHITAYMNVTYV